MVRPALLALAFLVTLGLAARQPDAIGLMTAAWSESFSAFATGAVLLTFAALVKRAGPASE